MNPQPESPVLAQRLIQVLDLGQRVCAVLQAEYRKLGFPPEQVPRVAFDDLRFELQQDPFSQEFSLHGTWRDARRLRLGALIVHADGSFFAEYDVVKHHPSYPQWFVEAVTAWGRADEVKAEPRLLPAQ